MNDHSHRLVSEINEAIESFLSGKMEPKQLFQIVEGNINAIEEDNVKRKLEKFLVVINDSIYLYDEIEGKAYLSKEYEKLNLG
jgi:hypothetical protein